MGPISRTTPNVVRLRRSESGSPIGSRKLVRAALGNSEDGRILRWAKTDYLNGLFAIRDVLVQ